MGSGGRIFHARSDAVRALGCELGLLGSDAAEVGTGRDVPVGLDGESAVGAADVARSVPVAVLDEVGCGAVVLLEGGGVLEGDGVPAGVGGVELAHV